MRNLTFFSRQQVFLNQLAIMNIFTIYRHLIFLLGSLVFT